MININYQSSGTTKLHLRLRLYSGGETRYVSVSKLLKGNPLPRHWSQKKQMFTGSCPYREENNQVIAEFRQKYELRAINWTGTLTGLLASIEEESIVNDAMSVPCFIQQIIQDKLSNLHPDGSAKGTFEAYRKLNQRLIEFCKAKHLDYNKLLLSELTAETIEKIFTWVNHSRNGKGYEYISKTLHSVIMKADKAGHLNADDFKRCNWKKYKNSSANKFDTLTEDQIALFKAMDLDDVVDSSKNELYRDFCLFILQTGQSACDALTLRYSDIKQIGGISHFVFKRRKIAEKQMVPCTVPISEELEKIMFKWRKYSKDDYIFPVRSKKKLATQETNNGDIKHFVGYLNGWLKKVGSALGCKFPLKTYTFRHTAITRYISKGVPVVYVANMMGTSVENCEKIYYNNQGDIASRNKVLAAMSC